MKLFWLSQNGEGSTRPLLLSQLKALAQKGQLTAEDLLCEDGSEDWQPVTAVLGELPSGAVAPPPALERLRPANSPLPEAWTTEEPPPPQRRRSDWLLWVLAAVLALAAAGGSWFYFFADSHESVPLLPTTRVLHSKVQAYLQDRMPSGEIRVDDVGPPMPWSDAEFRVVHCTVGGGPQNMVIRFNPRSQEVSRSWSPEDWMEQFSKTPDAGHYPGTVRIISDAAKAAAPGG